MKMGAVEYMLIGIALLIVAKPVNGIGAIKKTKWADPYDDNGKANFGDMKNKAGVYLIKENGNIVYVGYSKNNVYRTMYRHFETWNHAGQDVITYKTRLARNEYKVRVIKCTPEQAMRVEAMLIFKYKPRDNSFLKKEYDPKAGDNKLMQKVMEADPF